MTRTRTTGDKGRDSDRQGRARRGWIIYKHAAESQLCVSLAHRVTKPALLQVRGVLEAVVGGECLNVSPSWGFTEERREGLGPTQLHEIRNKRNALGIERGHRLGLWEAGVVHERPDREELAFLVKPRDRTSISADALRRFGQRGHADNCPSR